MVVPTSADVVQAAVVPVATASVADASAADADKTLAAAVANMNEVPAVNTTAGVGSGPANSDVAAASELPTKSILAVSAVVAATGTGAVYYVDNVLGSDSNTGTSPTVGTSNTGPWKTLAKVAKATIGAGDTVRLTCGRTWTETLKLPASGTSASPITIGAYPSGCTTPPLIDGSISIASSSWTQYQGNIYRAPLAVEPQQLMAGSGQLLWPAHYPNRGFDTTDPNSMYLRIAAADKTVVGGRSTSTYLTTGSDLKLPAGVTLQPGTKLRIRTNSWVLDETTISSVNGTKLTLSSSPEYPLAAGWGYYLMGQLWMLDSPGEWYYDSVGKYLYAWMPDSTKPTMAMSAGQLAAGIDLQSLSYVVVDGLSVRMTVSGINMRGSKYVTVRNSKILDSYGIGIDAAMSTAASIDANTILRSGIDAVSGLDSNTTASTLMQVTNNTISQAGVVMNGDSTVSLPRRSYGAIRVGLQSVVTGNTVRDSGYNGIRFMDGSQVSNNYVYGACSVLDDCGGIYTSHTVANTTISDNIVEHVRGAASGKPALQAVTQAQGIYLDEYATAVTVKGNTVVDADNGIQLHIAANNVIQANKLYGNRINQMWLQESNNAVKASGDLYGNVITDNIMVPVASSAKSLLQETVISSTTAFARYDRNRYFDSIYGRVASEKTPTAQQDYTFPLWRGAVTSTGVLRNLDPNGQSSSETRFATLKVTGSNIVPNGSLADDMKGWFAGTPANSTFAREACDRGYCMRYTAGVSTGLVSTPNFSIKQDQWYRLSMDIQTGADGQEVQVAVRRGGGGANGYESLSNVRVYATVGTAWKRHTAVFKATKTVKVNDTTTGDFGARIDIQNILPGLTVRVANVEIVPTTAADAATRTDILVNNGLTAIQVACPALATTPAACASYVRLADETVVTWPVYLAPRSSDIIYTRDSSLVDTDGDGIPDAQDSCPGTTAGTPVNAAGCSLAQR